MILNAKPFVDFKINELKERVSNLLCPPTLALIRVGNDPASIKYVNNKIKRCEQVGIVSEVHELAEDATQRDVARLINRLNNNGNVTAILLQLPLPDHLDENYLTNLINPEKDVDGFTATNTGKLSLGMDCNVACTPKGIIDLLEFYEIDLESKDVVIVNASNIVGKPLAQLFLQKGATPTICHKQTKNLKDKVKSADIVVLATGNANFLGADDFSEGTVIVDVSINFDDNGKMCGDVVKSDYEKLIDKGCYITPVPGGIGQCTVIALIENTVIIKEREENILLFDF
jgi:methylenetetrahydrofolate dehydrogenase (NADP+)/methenyltetrahydrofolate cyclohydrolase